MGLLLIRCGDGILTNSIRKEAEKSIPKIKDIHTMMLNLDAISLPEFKYTLKHINVDQIIIDPPRISKDKLLYNSNVFNYIVESSIQCMKVIIGKVMLVSSVETLGDSEVRTEAGMDFAFSDAGVFLKSAEMLLEKQTSRYFIMRTPMAFEDLPTSSDQDIRFNLAHPEDIAKVCLEQLQSGWFGKFHLSPNDEMLLSDIYPIADKSRPVDQRLMTKYNWQMRPTREVFDACRGTGN